MGDAAGVPPRFGLFIGSLRFAALSAIGVVVGTRTYLQSLWTQNGGVFSLPSDESYVLLHPARRLMEGTGLQGLEDVVTFGSSLVQDGLSSPSYAVVLAVAAQLGVGVEALPQLVVILGMAAHWVVLNALAQICDRIAPRWAKYVLLLVFAAGMPMTLRWAISGSLGAWGMAHVGVLLVQWQTLMDRDPVAESAAGPARRREATRRAEWFLGLLGLITWLAQPHALPLVLALAASIAIRRGWLGGAVAALAGAIRVLLPTAIVAGPLLHVLRSQADWPALSALNALWSPAMPAAVGNLVYGSWVQVNFEQLLAAVAPAPVPAVLTVVVSAAALLWARARLLVMTLFVLAAVAIFTLSLRPILEAPDDLARYESYGWLLLLWTLGLSLSLDALWRRPIRWGGVFSKLTGAAGLVALLSLVIARGGAQQSEERWFFARAAHNLSELNQSVIQRVTGGPVLVPRCGALSYWLGRAALDRSGRCVTSSDGLPMARAALMGIPATIELIERLPPRMWPSWMVVEPEDAAALAAMVGRRTQFHQATQPVVVAQPQLLSGRMQLNALDAFGLPRGNMGVAGAGTNLADTLLVDAVDLVDVVSERAHAVTRGATFVQGRVLDDLAVGRELFDAGYLLTAGQGLCARLNIPVDGARLVIRTVVDAPITFRTTLSATGCGSEQDGSEQGTWHATTRLASSPGWSEPILEVPPLAQLPLQAMEEGTLWIEWSAEHGELPLFHVWVLSKARNP